jgi:hypothetical protein
MDAVLAEVHAGMKRSRTNQVLDSWLGNGGVAFTVVCTGATTIVRAVWVGIDRALMIGSRWKFHRPACAGHRSIHHRFLSHDMLPPEERDAELRTIRASLVKLPLLDPDVPGIPGRSQVEHREAY